MSVLGACQAKHKVKNRREERKTCGMNEKALRVRPSPRAVPGGTSRYIEVSEAVSPKFKRTPAAN